MLSTKLHEREAVIGEQLLLDALNLQASFNCEVNENDANDKGEKKVPASVEKLRELLAEDAIDLGAIQELDLSFRSIYHINHLQGFQSLVKLKLDNNKIKRIENLGHLINLRWLDLSFNQITKLEGLEGLVNLTDLSLVSNNIETIENLEENKNLEVLSLTNNKIRNLGDIEFLRQFKLLKILNLKGNPVTEQTQEYENSVYAFLKVEFLDYKRICNEERILAREEKTEYLNSLAQKEAKEAKRFHAEEKQTQRNLLLKSANIEGVETIFDDMMKDDVELFRLKLLPDFDVHSKTFQDNIKEKTERFVHMFLANRRNKIKQDKMFQTAYDTVCEKTETECKALIQTFEIEKNQYLLTKNFKISEIQTKLETLNFKLMSLEMEQSELVMSMINKYDDILDDAMRLNLKQCEDYFLNLNDVEEEFAKHIEESAEKILQIAMQEGPDSVVNPSLDDHGLEQLRTLSLEKDLLRNAINSSHDNRISHIGKVEDAVRDREENEKKNKIETVQESETERSRRRCSEIYDKFQLEKVSNSSG